MRAAVLSEVHAPLALEEIPTPAPQAGEVLVHVDACGVCHTDLHVMKGEVKFPTPAVLGHEISGTVASLGPGVAGASRRPASSVDAAGETRLREGMPVVCSFIMPCGVCARCAEGRDDLCETFFAMNRLRGTLYDGTTRLARRDGSPLAMYSMGGLAEYAVVPATDVFPLPEALPVPESCIIGCAIMTAYGAVHHQAALQPGETAAVVAAGGVGSNIIQLAAAFGASAIIAVDVRDDKLDAARRIGATHTVNAAKVDAAAAMLEHTEGRGVDVAFEALGRPETVALAFGAVRDGGRVVIVGIAPGATAAPIEITRLVRRGIRLIGSYGARVRTDIPALLRLAERRVIDPARTISRRYTLAQAPQAYDALSRGEIVGRAIVVTE